MAESIVPNPIFNLASDIADEVNGMAVALRLANAAVQFQCADPQSAGNAQGELLFLLRTLDAIQKRLDALSDSAYALSHLEVQAAA